MVTREQEAYIRNRVHELYYGVDMNCARTTLTCLSEILSFPIGKEAMDSAIGLHGAGGFRAQCGLVEGPLMFLGIFGTAKGLPLQEVVFLCRSFAESFQKEFGSLTCHDLRPGGFRNDDPPHLCEKLTVKAICFSLSFVVEKLGERP